MCQVHTNTPSFSEAFSEFLRKIAAESHSTGAGYQQQRMASDGGDSVLVVFDSSKFWAGLLQMDAQRATAEKCTAVSWEPVGKGHSLTASHRFVAPACRRASLCLAAVQTEAVVRV